MFLITPLVNAVKRIGVDAAIAALDTIVTPLAARIEAERKKLQALDAHAVSQWIIDRVQLELRKFFKIKTSEEK